MTLTVNSIVVSLQIVASPAKSVQVFQKIQENISDLDLGEVFNFEIEMSSSECRIRLPAVCQDSTGKESLCEILDAAFEKVSELCEPLEYNLVHLNGIYMNCVLDTPKDFMLDKIEGYVKLPKQKASELAVSAIFNDGEKDFDLIVTDYGLLHFLYGMEGSDNLNPVYEEVIVRIGETTPEGIYEHPAKVNIKVRLFRFIADNNMTLNQFAERMYTDAQHIFM